MTATEAVARLSLAPETVECHPKACHPGASYVNDELGNRTWKNYPQSTVQRYVWDEVNRLSSYCTLSQGAKYTYRADGLRIKKVEGLTLSWVDDDSVASKEASSGHYDEVWTVNKPTTRYFYDGQMTFEEDFTTSPSGTPQKTVTRYALGLRGIESIETTDPQSQVSTVYPLYDGHGNMVATISRSAPTTCANVREYDAWGDVRAGSGTGAPSKRYSASLGHVQDDESDLIYMRARYYEPATGRFVSEDPAGDGLNWYVYCWNNPITQSDPSGKFTLGDLGSSLRNGLRLSFGNARQAFRALNKVRSMAEDLQDMTDFVVSVMIEDIGGLQNAGILDQVEGLSDLDRDPRKWRKYKAFFRTDEGRTWIVTFFGEERGTRIFHARFKNWWRW